ncbi:MAG: hypothetical protein FWE72_03135 [Spirochaetaceae bacterium]|nr:hypothetical protein [Spirochaetaceae bacterium]
MLLFLLLIFPIASIWIISEDLLIKQMILDLRDYFLFGILFFIPSLFFVNILVGFFSQTYTFLNIYFYHFLADYFFFQFFCILSCMIRYRNKMSISTGEGITHYFLFMAGFYTAFTFYSAINNYNSADLYTLFIRPVALLLMAAYASVFLTFRDAETGVIKHLFTALISILPAILAFVPFFFYIRFPLFSFIIIFVMTIPGFYFLYKNRNT